MFRRRGRIDVNAVLLIDFDECLGIGIFARQTGHVNLQGTLQSMLVDMAQRDGRDGPTGGMDQTPTGNGVCAGIVAGNVQQGVQG